MESGANYEFQTIAKAITYIQNNFKKQPSLEEVAESVHVSPYHFQRMFTEWAGISPKKYLKHISAMFAKTLMKGGNFTLSEVSYLTGLSGTGRLHDLFVTMEAMTPGEYNSGGEQVEIEYGYYSTPFGEVLLAATAKGICKLSFIDNQIIGKENVPMKKTAFSELQGEWPGASFKEDEGKNEFLVQRIFSDELFYDEEDKLKLNIKGTPFQLKVWEALLKIPQGSMATYNQVSELIGKPGASRAVGAAIGKNPVAMLIPCHRVINQSGALSGYRWNPERKLSILNWEQCQTFHDEVA